MGDIMGHSPQINSAYNTENKQYEYDDVFYKVAPIIKKYDFAIANLEVTLGGKPYTGYPTFSSPDALAVACKNAGIDELILDLRYNSGGYVTSATRLASMISGVSSKNVFIQQQVNPKLEKLWGNTLLSYFTERTNTSPIHTLNFARANKKLYVLEMFSYPSGAKLHLGHWYNYGLTDCYARLQKMRGYNVFHPMGFDSFGLPAENYAIKTGVHPEISTKQNIENMKVQLSEMGASFDWSYEIKTHEPEYYKWTQWLFTYLYKKGLAYKKEAPVNFCPSCNTVLANEQVIQGECERCGSRIERRKLSQWFFKITDYAEELLTGLEKLDWPELTKKIQQNWIGKSTGAEIEFNVEGKDIVLTAYTTRPDTLYGVSFVAVAPESDIAKKLITEDHRKEAEEYIQKTLSKSDIERQFTDREKTLAYTGSYAINPINGKKVPIILADYVLESYGTGIVMGVPAHDERDMETAKKYNIEIIPVIDENGIMINSDRFNGLKAEDFKKLVVEELEKQGKGRKAVKYKLKDWLVSRQRYWGAPIPIIYCDDCRRSSSRRKRFTSTSSKRCRI